jgi:hypothetical protein
MKGQFELFDVNRLEVFDVNRFIDSRKERIRYHLWKIG